MIDEKAAQTSRIADWQRMLGQIIEDEQILFALADELGMHPDSLKRWTQGTIPRNPVRTLRALYSASSFPSKLRGVFSEAVSKSFPDFEEVLNPLLEDIPVKEIPSIFYSQIYRSFAFVEESLIFTTLTNTICHWLYGHIDPDQSSEVSALILLCTPPADNCVRSFYAPIRQIGERPSPISSTFPLLVGLESPFADAKPRYERPLIFDASDIRELTSLDFPVEVKCLLAIPIQRRGRLAGWFLVSASKPSYWNEQRALVTYEYSLFLGLAFADQDFYKREQFSLGVYPSAAIQQQQQARYPYGKRLMELWKKNRSMQTEKLEVLAVQELEEDLLRMEETT
jgi:hypothetical protein